MTAEIPSEIVVTPQMIEAGREAISIRWMEFVGVSGYELWDEVLREVFVAMSAARPLSHRESQQTQAVEC
jgi:hypothetical protein